jgi:hypothetical protein
MSETLLRLVGITRIYPGASARDHGGPCLTQGGTGERARGGRRA